MDIKDNCEHLEFNVHANVLRLSEEENGPINGYRLEIEVFCNHCMKPFEFIGLPGGILRDIPTATPDNIQARMPIKPL